MSKERQQLYLPPHVREILTQLSTRSSLTYSEVTRQAILLVHTILTNPSATDAAIDNIRNQFEVR